MIKYFYIFTFTEGKDVNIYFPFDWEKKSYAISLSVHQLVCLSLFSQIFIYFFIFLSFSL